MSRIQVKTKSSGVSAVNSSPKILMGLVPTVDDLTDGLADYVHSAVYNEFLSPIKDEIKRLANGLTDRMQSTFHLSDDLTWIYTRISEAIYWTTINGVYSRKDDKGKVKYISDNSDLMYVIKNAVDWSGVMYEDVFRKELIMETSGKDHATVMAESLLSALDGWMEPLELGGEQREFREKFVSKKRYSDYSPINNAFMELGCKDGNMFLFDTFSYAKDEQVKVNDTLNTTLNFLYFVMLKMLSKYDLEYLKESTDAEDAFSRVAELLRVEDNLILEDALDYKEHLESLKTIVYNIVIGFNERSASILSRIKSIKSKFNSYYYLNLNVNFGHDGCGELFYLGSNILDEDASRPFNSIPKLNHELLESILGKDYEIPVDTENGRYIFKNAVGAYSPSLVQNIIATANKDGELDVMSPLGLSRDMPCKGFLTFRASF